MVFDWPAIWRAKDDPRSGFRPCVVEGNFVGMVEPAWFGTMEEMKEYCYKMMYDTLASSDRVRRFIEEIKTA